MAWKRFAAALLSAAAILGVGAGQALAAASWTVSPGGATTGTGTAGFKDSTTGNPLPTVCDSTMSITLKSGSGLPGPGIGSITSAAFTNCKWIVGYMPVLTPGHFPWSLSADQYDAATGVTHGTISGIHIYIAAPACTATIDGTGPGADNGLIAVTYKNGSHTLTVLSTGANLHYYKVSGCAGLVHSGDPATMSGSYAIAPAQTITSP